MVRSITIMIHLVKGLTYVYRVSAVVAEDHRAESEPGSQVVHGGSSPGAGNHRTLITASAM